MSKYTKLSQEAAQARNILRGNHDEELFFSSSSATACLQVNQNVDSSRLKTTAQSLGVVKMDGQRGMSNDAGLALLEAVKDRLDQFPPDEEIYSDTAICFGK